MKLRLEGALVRAGVVQPARNHALAQLENLALLKLPVLPATGSSRPSHKPGLQVIQMERHTGGFEHG